MNTWNYRPHRHFIAPLFFAIILPLSSPAAEEEPTTLRLKLPQDVSQRYTWSITSKLTSKGMVKGKPIDLKSEKNTTMTVVLRGGKRPTPKTILSILRFQGFALTEDREAGKDTKTRLEVGRNRIFYRENKNVLIDSSNDIGLERITDYQRQTRGLEKGELRVELESTGKPVRNSGKNALMETLHGGNTQSIFPVLPSKKIKTGQTWDAPFEINSLGDLTLDSPATVLTRARLAQWENRKGKRIALIEVIAAWQTKVLSGKHKDGLSVNITDLEGLGRGVYFFDPATGRYLDGEMTFDMKYKMDGKKKGESTSMDVKGQTKLSFKLIEPGSGGAKGTP